VLPFLFHFYGERFLRTVRSVCFALFCLVMMALLMFGKGRPHT
jgi:hypothetical protein